MEIITKIIIIIIPTIFKSSTKIRAVGPPLGRFGEGAIYSHIKNHINPGVEISIYDTRRVPAVDYEKVTKSTPYTG